MKFLIIIMLVVSGCATKNVTKVSEPRENLKISKKIPNMKKFLLIKDKDQIWTGSRYHRLERKFGPGLTVFPMSLDISNFLNKMEGTIYKCELLARINHILGSKKSGEGFWLLQVFKIDNCEEKT